MSGADPEVLEIFREEANERLDAIVDVLLGVEAGRPAPDAFEEVFRDAHTIKGSADMLGLDDVKTLAHAVEDVLDSLRENGGIPPAVADPLMRAADAMRAQVNGDGPARPDLIEELLACRDATIPVAAPGDASAPRPGESPSLTRRSLRVPAEKLDRLLDLVGETVVHRERLVHSLNGLGAGAKNGLQDELDLGDRLLAELQGAAIEARTLPLGSIAGRFPRAVRDIAVESGKDVQLVVEGEKTELDRVILERLSEPIVHLLRNAVAHGIEGPEEREREGKPACGRIVLSAVQRGRLVAVTIEDDGRGIPPEAADLELLARPGYSTREEVSELAGRGVGLAAVKSQVELLGGGLEVASEPGRGTRVTLLLPLTLALLDVLLVQRGRHVFGVPLSSVAEAVAVTETLSLVGKPALGLRGQTVPLLDLADLVGAEAPVPPPRPPALVVEVSGRRIAAICDRLIGEQQVVVKSLGSLLSGVRGYLGAAILGDERIALILDPAALIRADRTASRRAPAPRAAAQEDAHKLLVVEDSFTVRELQRSILEAAGYRVDTARNGKEALDRLTADAEIALVVTDVEMPEMDGLDLTRKIRARRERSSLPVIVVTSRAGEDDRRRGIDAGADAYLMKRNFEQSALIDTVARLLGS